MNEEENKEQRLALWLPAAAVGLTTAAVVFFSVWGWQTGKIEGAPAASEVVVVEESVTEVVPAARPMRFWPLMRKIMTPPKWWWKTAW